VSPQDLRVSVVSERLLILVVSPRMSASWFESSTWHADQTVLALWDNISWSGGYRLYAYQSSKYTNHGTDTILKSDALNAELWEWSYITLFCTTLSTDIHGGAYVFKFSIYLRLVRNVEYISKDYIYRYEKASSQVIGSTVRETQSRGQSHYIDVSLTHSNLA